MGRNWKGEVWGKREVIDGKMEHGKRVCGEGKG